MTKKKIIITGIIFLIVLIIIGVIYCFWTTIEKKKFSQNVSAIEPVPQRSSKNANGRHCTIVRRGNDLSVGDLMRYTQHFVTSVGE
jgi:hypothetical protein